ncbi:hypothetical protein [Absidia glauca]|uniref:Uncharacterized protein n=1 Tax=Absidia glauca TaxID=4829 RepID=A0A163JY06_ABSGL|nr:hypothetical protein [Absidia glauca]
MMATDIDSLKGTFLLGDDQLKKDKIEFERRLSISVLKCWLDQVTGNPFALRQRTQGWHHLQRPGISPNARITRLAAGYAPDRPSITPSATTVNKSATAFGVHVVSATKAISKAKLLTDANYEEQVKAAEQRLAGVSTFTNLGRRNFWLEHY